MAYVLLTVNQYHCEVASYSCCDKSLQLLERVSERGLSLTVSTSRLRLGQGGERIRIGLTAVFDRRSGCQITRSCPKRRLPWQQQQSMMKSSHSLETFIKTFFAQTTHAYSVIEIIDSITLEIVVSYR